MTKLVRFGVAVEDTLLARFDELIATRGWANRSEALRDLMRERLVDDEWRTDAETVGVVTLIYDHSVRELQERLTAMQHEFAGQVISTLHVHLDHDHCMEVVLVRGPGRAVGSFADRLAGLKGVVFGKLLPATLGTNLWEQGHDHDHGHDHGHDHERPAARRRRARPHARAAARPSAPADAEAPAEPTHGLDRGHPHFHGPDHGRIIRRSSAPPEAPEPPSSSRQRGRHG